MTTMLPTKSAEEVSEELTTLRTRKIELTDRGQKLIEQIAAASSRLRACRERLGTSVISGDTRKALRKEVEELEDQLATLVTDRVEVERQKLSIDVDVLVAQTPDADELGGLGEEVRELDIRSRDAAARLRRLSNHKFRHEQMLNTARRKVDCFDKDDGPALRARLAKL